MLGARGHRRAAPVTSVVSGDERPRARAVQDAVAFGSASRRDAGTGRGDGRRRAGAPARRDRGRFRAAERALGRGAGAHRPCGWPRRVVPAGPLCGDRRHFTITDADVRNLGPTPRVRGAHRRAHRGFGGGGTNPARAGSTTDPEPGALRNGDQPRACGEHSCSANSAAGVPGPTPRVRGALVAAVDPPAGLGTNPARAGSTEYRGSWDVSVGDQPRACGEHATPENVLVRQGGPTPRVRGARSSPPSQNDLRGTNPARAGSTPGGLGPGRERRDQPRACGEHQPGVPPRDRRRDLGGTNPARAGSTEADQQRFASRGPILTTSHDSDLPGVLPLEVETLPKGASWATARAGQPPVRRALYPKGEPPV